MNLEKQTDIILWEALNVNLSSLDFVLNSVKASRFLHKEKE